MTNLPVHGIVTFASDMAMNCTEPSYFDTSTAQSRTVQGSCMVDELHRTVTLAVVADLVIQMMVSGPFPVLVPLVRLFRRFSNLLAVVFAVEAYYGQNFSNFLAENDRCAPYHGLDAIVPVTIAAMATVALL